MCESHRQCAFPRLTRITFAIISAPPRRVVMARVRTKSSIDILRNTYNLWPMSLVCESHSGDSIVKSTTYRTIDAMISLPYTSRLIGKAKLGISHSGHTQGCGAGHGQIRRRASRREGAISALYVFRMQCAYRVLWSAHGISVPYMLFGRAVNYDSRMERWPRRTMLSLGPSLIRATLWPRPIRHIARTSQKHV
jgi:hypothetical protein